MKKYISIYHAKREHGGSEEGGWSYWGRGKIHDIKVCFDTDAKVQRALSRLIPVLKRVPEFADDLPHMSRLEAHVFTGKHGPEEYSEPSIYS
tara:strand:+ start:430 stop:705 length:276 start_codon:yes stop_codon:yes gene_type:complete